MIGRGEAGEGSGCDVHLTMVALAPIPETDDLNVHLSQRPERLLL